MATCAKSDRLNNKKRLDLFSMKQKIELIKVKKHPIIYDITDKKHYDAVLTKSAWKGIAERLDQNVDQVRVVWKALRGSHRYHLKAAAKNSGLQQDQPVANDAVDWYLAPYMAFLPEPLANQRTCTAFVDVDPSVASTSSVEEEHLDCESKEALETSPSNDSNVDSDEIAEEPIMSISSAYSCSKPSKIRKSEQPKHLQEMMGMLGDFIGTQKELIASQKLATSSSICLFWEESLAAMDPQLKMEAEEEMTQVLFKFKRLQILGKQREEQWSRSPIQIDDRKPMEFS